ncbi:hypothetical protein BDV95DRAFT_599244 [Massariosphaeria phaeospora]|uniref:Glycoside hydrolase/deacetylase n=1 Tax=Massariosphaeria phaeospora TaxID=100035 RepID=A0A7C8M1D5_9PLEO|nr:hypothetical protein BDV95DRAFT_599244 [Massariosphaeria phaeospora]
MYFSTTLAVVAAVAPFVTAHDGAPIPRIVGLNVKDLRTRDMFSTLKARLADSSHHEAPHNHGRLDTRQNTQDQCGGSFGSCAPGYCCSGSGWCGNTDEYCYSPGCNYQYGPGCPENQTPAGTNTSSIARTKVGNVAYGGAGIYECVQPGTVALTYDDGPFKGFTNHVLDVFKTYNAKATFFITGNNINKGQIDTDADFKATIQRMNAEGHHIASHTWTHLDLSAVTSLDRKQQMWKNEMALRNILGFIPTYMRPPYSSCTAGSGCEKDMADLGYHVTYFDVDTDDYNQDTPDKIQNSKNWFRGNITQAGSAPSNDQFLAIGHDIHEQTAYNLTDYMLSTLTQLGYRAVTVGECLGDPKANWYRTGAGTPVSSTRVPSASTRASSAPAPTGTKKASTDATCGGTGGFTCQGSTFGNCCSASGWCGTTADYCGTGCQSTFGTCGTSGGVSSAVSSVRPVTTRTSAAPAPSSTNKVSADGTCGGTTGNTCQGSSFGNCCSQYGWCGSTTGHCGTGCIKGFGTCT